MLSSRDTQDLSLAIDLMEWSKEIIAGIMNRHVLDRTMQMVSFANGVTADIDEAEREAHMLERYMSWSKSNSSIADGSATADMNWSKEGAT